MSRSRSQSTHRKSKSSRYHRLPLSLERLEFRDVPAYAFVGGAADATLDLTDAGGNLAGGATVAIAPSGSNPTASISLGSNKFNFYGTDYDAVFVSYNGLLTFGKANNLAGNANLGTTLSLGEAAIAPLWDQWFSTTSFDSKGVIAKLDAPNNRLIVQWDRMEDDIGADDVTFQAILALNSGITPGNITFNYLDVDTGNANSSNGKSATVGVKESNPGVSQPAQLFTLISHNATNANVSGGKSIALNWDNTAPQNLALALSVPLLNENDVLTLGGTFTDPDVIDTHTITINWGDGSANTTLNPAKGVYDFAGVTHKYLDNPASQPTGKYTITATFKDSQGESSVKTAEIQVNNVTPTVSIGGDATIDEGGTFARAGSFFDPGTLDAPFVADVDYGDGSGKQPLSLTGATFSLNHTYADQGKYTVTVYTRDKDNATGESSLAVTVLNVLPTVTLDGGLGSPTVNEGTELVLNSIATFSDPGLTATEVRSWTINWGDGSSNAKSLPGASGTIGGKHTYADNGTYTVTVSVLDNVGPAVSKTFLVNVTNVVPVVTLNGSLAVPQAASEGKTITINDIATFVDPGFDNASNPNGATAETFTFTVAWGDGTASTVGAPTISQVGSAGTNTAGKFGASHIYADDGLYTVTVTVTDDDGGASTAKTFGVQVGSTNPSISSPATNRSANEGATLTIPTLATFTDFGFTNPSNPNQPGGSQETFTYSIVWGDGTAKDTGAVLDVTQGSAGVLTTGAIHNVAHVFADDGVYTVTFSIDDDNGGTVSQQFQVTVGNIAPTVTVINNQTVNEGNKLSLPTVATFTDPGFDNPANPNGASVESFTYSINWGDGTSADAGPVAAVIPGSASTATSGAVNDVSHTYADDGAYTVTVTIVDDNGGSTSKTFTVTVNNVAPSITGIAADTNVNEGSSLSIANLVSFADPGFNNPANPNGASVESFTYSINWGDGTSSEGGNVSLVANGSSGISTSGQVQNVSHTYADDGFYTVTVTVTDDNGGTTNKAFTVTVDNVAPSVTIVGNKTAAEGSLLSVPGIVTFTDPGFNNPNNPNGASVESFTYSIIWGDGTAPDAGGVVNVTNGGVGALTKGSLDGSHTYADNGTYTVSVTITDDNGGATTKSFQVAVSNVAPVVSIVGDQLIDEGATLSFPQIASWTDAGFDNAANPNSQPGGSKESFTYSINWGDGTTADGGTVSSGNVVQGSPGTATTGFQPASHVYADNGVYSVTVTITDDDGAAASKSFGVTVGNVAPTLTAAVGDQSTTEGALVALPTLATFTDPGFDNATNPNGKSVERFTYTINWGDGATETKAVANFASGSVGTPSSGQFGGSHTYADNGVYTVTATVLDDDTGLSNQVSFTVTVAGAAPNLNVSASQSVVEGSVLNLAPIATFTDPGFSNPTGVPATAETFTYVVNWGDGSTNSTGSATVTQVGFPGSATLGTVAASHVYADDGSYTVTVTVTDDDGDATTKTFTVNVSNAAPAMTVIAPQAFAEGETFVLPTIGTLSDVGFANPSNPNGASEESFTFTINWGDGTTPDTGSANLTQLGSAGVPTLAAFGGGHTYDRVGNFTVTVRATDDDDGFDEKTFTVTVTNVPPTLLLTNGNLATTEGKTVDLPNLGTFTDPGFSTSETYSYSIAWGDGSVSKGAATVDQLGSIGVRTKGSFGSSHAYGDNGLYTVQVVLTDSNGGTDTASFQIQVGNVAPSLTLNVGPTVTIPEGSQLSLPNLASFSDPGFGIGETYTYTIAWGDGSTSSGKANIFQVGGPDQPALGKFGEAHTYAKNGSYPVTVTLADKDGDSDSATFTVEAVNVAPTNLIYTLAPMPVTEGSTIELSGSFTDPGLFDPHTVTVDWGDGSAPAAFSLLAGVTFFSTRNVGGNFLTHTYAQNSTGTGYPLTVTVTDDAGLFTVVPTATVVQNVAPTVTIATPQKVTRDVRFVVTSAVSDPGVQDKLSYSWQVIDPDGKLVQTATTQNLEYTAPRSGKHTISLTVSDEDGGSTTKTATIRVQNAEIFVIAADAGGGPRVAIFDSKTQTRVTDFFAYEESYRGGVTVAVGDTQGDGTADIVTATGPGGGPRVRVIDSETFETVNDLFVYEESYRGGMFLAVGDVDGDGCDDIATAPDKGGGPRVKVISGKTLATIYDDFVFDPDLRVGVRIGVNDLNGDGFADFVVGTGPGVAARVRAIDVHNNKVLFDSVVYDESFTGGVYLAAGDIQGDGKSDIIVAAGPGGGPHVKAIDVASNKTLAQFFAYESTYTGGVRVAAFDYDGDGRSDVLTGTGPGGGPAHRIWQPFTNEILESFFSFEESFLGGVYVGAGD